MKKTKSLIAALLIAGVSFGQLNNCINTKEHPLIQEIFDSVKTNNNYRSMLAFTVINGDRIGLAKSTTLNLAYAWASCKKIANPEAKKDEEFKFLEAILDEKEFERLISFTEKINKNGKVQQE